jgi:hypothetical protein
MSNYDMIKKEAHNVYALCGTHTNSIAWREKKTLLQRRRIEDYKRHQNS